MIITRGPQRCGREVCGRGRVVRGEGGGIRRSCRRRCLFLLPIAGPYADFTEFSRDAVLSCMSYTNIMPHLYAITSKRCKTSKVAVASPWDNGMAEVRVNRFLKSLLKKLVEESRDWKLWLSTAFEQYIRQ